VIDAAGAIYVIGGGNGTLSQDVWASTDGGARPEYVGGGTTEYSRTSMRVEGTARPQVLGGTKVILRGTQRVLRSH
jgi:hypothetical protein